MSDLDAFRAKVDAQLIAEQGWLRWAFWKVRARVMVGWRLRWYYFRHPEAVRYVSQEAFDAFSAADLDPLTPIDQSPVGGDREE